MRTTPLAPGDQLPTLELSHADGRPASLDTIVGQYPVVVYFMRTPHCPVCHSHLRHMERSPEGTTTLADRTVVVGPGGAEDAAAVARRHPAFAERVMASTTAHESVGLFVRAGLQQSGTFVVNSAGAVVAARTSTIPLGAYDEPEVRAALEEAIRPA